MFYHEKTCPFFQCNITELAVKFEKPMKRWEGVNAHETITVLYTCLPGLKLKTQDIKCILPKFLVNYSSAERPARAHEETLLLSPNDDATTRVSERLSRFDNSWKLLLNACVYVSSASELATSFLIYILSTTSSRQHYLVSFTLSDNHDRKNLASMCHDSSSPPFHVFFSVKVDYSNKKWSISTLYLIVQSVGF